MEITLPLFSNLYKLIRELTVSRAVAFFAIILSSFSYTNLEAQITSVTSDNNPSCFGTAINFTGTVGATTGNVLFYDGTVAAGNLLATIPVTAGGTAVYNTSTLAVGTHT